MSKVKMDGYEAIFQALEGCAYGSMPMNSVAEYIATKLLANGFYVVPITTPPAPILSVEQVMEVLDKLESEQPEQLKEIWSDTPRIEIDRSWVVDGVKWGIDTIRDRIQALAAKGNQ